MDDYLGMGVGWLNMTPVEFYECRVGHFFSALAYYGEQKNREARLISELTRRQTVDLLNIQLKKADRLKPEQLWTFPWDAGEEEEAEELTDEQIKERNEQIIKELLHG